VTPDLEIAVQLRGEASSAAARALILATGARERFLPFPGWTLPNVMGIGGAQALLKAGASFTGLRVVIAGSGPLLLPVAATLARDGARLALVAEQAPTAQVLRFSATLWRFPGKIIQAAGYRSRFPGVRYAWNTWVVSASGDDRVREVTLTDGRRTWTERCDVLCTGYGLVPSAELARLLGCAVESGRVVTDTWQRTSLECIYCAGEPTGIAGVEAALVEGEIAGLAVCGREGEAATRFGVRDRYHRFSRQLEAAFAPRDELRSLLNDDTVVCRCEDVTYRCLRPEWSTRQAKLYTRAGMGPCQGRVCGPAVEYLFGWPLDTVRVPVEPATVNTLVNTVVSSGGSSSEHGHGET
ncbi:MAG TPA: FAD-dependent oxidoreductase, partial [Chloroflexota bacterium]|nr:FAD-dependent oxidoreductase [Chloroflexota bacterium]